MKKYLLFVKLLLVLVSFSYAQNLSGTDFWFAFPENNTHNKYEVIINSSYCASGTITFPAWGAPFGSTPYSVSFSVTPGTATVEVLGDEILSSSELPGSGAAALRKVYLSANGLQNKGFHIVSDSAITVTAVVYDAASVDAETVSPITKLGTNYVVMGRQYSNVGTPISTTYFTVGATQPATDITIVNRVTGATTNITLNAGETYRVSSTVQNCNSDKSATSAATCETLSGTTVTATSGAGKPIYVIDHADCSRMTSCGACDIIMGQMLPTNLWASKYITAQVTPRKIAICGETIQLPVDVPNTSMADFLEIVGPSGTTVWVDNWQGTPGQTYTIPASATGYNYVWHMNAVGGPGAENIGEANTVIRSSAPVQVAQYVQDTYRDNAAPGTEDPEMTILYPESMWDNGYVFSSSPELTSLLTSIVVVVNNVGVPAPTSTIELDGANIGPAGWRLIGSTTYRFKRVSVSIGAVHAVRSTSGYNFGMYTNAVGSAESYVVQGGGTLRYPFVDCTVLPIDLIEFTGTNVGAINKLEWKTASELNSDYYKVEKSINGVDFKEIGRVSAAGNSNKILDYSLFDPTPSKGINYYRLNAFDKNGISNYSNIITIENSLNFELVNVAYLEYERSINLSYLTKLSGKTSLVLRNVAGVVIIDKQAQSITGENSSKINVGALPKGIYFLTIKLQDGEVYHSKVGIY